MPIPPRLLNGSRREYTIGHLLEGTPIDPTLPDERRLLSLVLPPWQRRETWALAQKQRFIEGIFLGFGCGSYVINGSDWLDDGRPAPMSGWLLDGQQRISALRDFFANDLVVFGDVTYSSFTTAESLRLKREPFHCYEIEYNDNEDTLIELYDRLNYSGTPHTPEQRVLPRKSPVGSMSR